MGDVRFRLLFGTRPATAEELGRVEEIVVEQERDVAWEARLKLAMCVDETGHWRHAPDEFARPFSRVRIELDPGSGAFVPLIDGPVAAYDTALDALPGRSTVTLVVRDDSVLLNREEAVERFEDRSDADIARQVLGAFGGVIGEQRVRATSGTRPTVRRGTAIQFLRQLARANGYHAYVLPGDAAGRSVGCFLPDPETPGTLPPLVLLGPTRNLADVQVRENADGPATTRAHVLRIDDQGIAAAESHVADVGLMRPLPAVPAQDEAIRLLRPEDHDREDPTERAAAETRRAAYAYRVTGRVVPGCYAAVLTPYQRVTVRTGDLPLSGEWLLTKVTHRITPSLWTQEFEGACDSRHDPAASEADAPAATGLSVSFSASLSIF